MRRRTETAVDPSDAEANANHHEYAAWYQEARG